MTSGRVHNRVIRYSALSVGSILAALGLHWLSVDHTDCVHHNQLPQTQCKVQKLSGAKDKVISAVTLTLVRE